MTLRVELPRNDSTFDSKPNFSFGYIPTVTVPHRFPSQFHSNSKLPAWKAQFHGEKETANLIRTEKVLHVGGSKLRGEKSETNVIRSTNNFH